MKIVTTHYNNETLNKLYDYLIKYYDSGYLWALQPKQHEFLLENCGFKDDIVNSMWKLVILEKSIRARKPDNEVIENIKQEIKETKDIFQICSKYKIQPAFLKRHIDKKYFIDKQFGYKEKYDLFGKYQSELSRVKGEKFEKKIALVLKASSYDNYKTEKEQKESGISKPTPDFLYNEKFDFFRYKDIQWIEVKSYPGFYDTIKYYGVLKQVLKYVSNYGKGILLVNDGFSKSFKELIEKKTKGQVVVLAIK